MEMNVLNITLLCSLIRKLAKMLICSPIHDQSMIYLYTSRFDNTPFTFNYVTDFAAKKIVQYVEFEHEEPDDDGNIYIEEIEVYVIPTNSYKLITFKNETERVRFIKIINQYYFKEIA